MATCFNLRLAGRVSLTALTLVMVACSTGADDGSDYSNDDLRIKPVGTETMSTLVVQLPANTCLPGGACSRVLSQQPNITLDGAAMTLGNGLRVVPGKHTLAVGPTKTTVNLDAGKTRTMTLPVVRRACTNGDAANVPATDFGRVPALHYAACPPNATLDGNAMGNAPGVVNFYIYSGVSCNNYLGQMIQQGQGCAALRAGQYTVTSIYGYTAGNAQALGCFAVPAQDALAMCNTFQAGGPGAIGLGTPFPDGNIAVVPGSYAFQIEGAAAATTFAVAEGDAKDLALTLPQIGSIPSTFDTRLTFADARELPDAVAATITSNCERNYSVPASAKDTVTLKAFQFAECNYALNAGGRTVALGQAAAGNDVTLHRVDMDDVVVTREDGSTFTVKGTFEVYFGGNRVAGPYNTGSGIDLLGGAYEVVVKYNTAEGQKTNTYDINL
jgi:hypothetical protein